MTETTNSGMTASHMARLAALAKPYNGSPPTETVSVRSRETIRLMSTKKVSLNHEFALKILELPEIPGDRNLKPRLVNRIITAIRRNTMRYELVQIAVAKCCADGIEYRENGQHTCRAVLAMPADWEHEKVTYMYYECDTLEDVRALYASFDQGGPRSKSDVVISLLKATPQFDGVSDRLIKTLSGGMSFWLWEPINQRTDHDGEDIAYLIQNDHAVTANRVVAFALSHGGFTKRDLTWMDRSAVFAAMLEIFAAVPTKAAEFWEKVVTGAELKEGDPRLKLHNSLMVAKLLNAQAKTTPKNGVNAASEEMYRWCIQAWNAWRAGETMRVLRAKMDKPRPKAR